MLDQQPVTPVPVTGPVQVQGLLVSVGIAAGSGGLGLVDPPLWDQQPLGQEALPADRLVRVLQGAVEGQHVPHRSLPLTEHRNMTISDDSLTAATSLCTDHKLINTLHVSVRFYPIYNLPNVRGNMDKLLYKLNAMQIHELERNVFLGRFSKLNVSSH